MVTKRPSSWSAAVVASALVAVSMLASPTVSADQDARDGARWSREVVSVGEYAAVGQVGACTGTLIGKARVLTAAHCVCPWSGLAACEDRATFTLRDVYPVDDPGTEHDESSVRTDVHIEGDVRVHPDFGRRGWLREDIAVIRLDRPATELTVGLEPIPLARACDTPLPGDRLTMVGYGMTGLGCSDRVAGKAKLGFEVGESTWAGIGFGDTDEDACLRASGGPVLDSVGRVVGIASWGDTFGRGMCRPTGFSDNWIRDVPESAWADCDWARVRQPDPATQAPTSEWIPDGSFLVALDLDLRPGPQDRSDTVVGRVQHCALPGASWGRCAWVTVGQKSHAARSAWCADGSYLTQLVLDRPDSGSESDALVVSRARCCSLAGGEYGPWGSTYWKGVESAGIDSHQAVRPWCVNGAFLTQFDLDVEVGPDGRGPVVAQAKCSAPRTYDQRTSTDEQPSCQALSERLRRPIGP
jgi:hypothetical protein